MATMLPFHEKYTVQPKTCCNARILAAMKILLIHYSYHTC